VVTRRVVAPKERAGNSCLAPSFGSFTQFKY
jgi:hypothetical protein